MKKYTGSQHNIDAGRLGGNLLASLKSGQLLLDVCDTFHNHEVSPLNSSIIKTR